MFTMVEMKHTFSKYIIHYKIYVFFFSFTEDTRNHPISLCSGTKRIRHIYLSATHKVELMMTNDMSSDEQGHFILRHEGMVLVFEFIIYNNQGIVWTLIYNYIVNT